MGPAKLVALTHLLYVDQSVLFFFGQLQLLDHVTAQIRCQVTIFVTFSALAYQQVKGPH